MTQEQSQVLEAVKCYLDGYAKGDVEQCMSVMSGTGPVLMIGTNMDEVLESGADIRDAIERDMQHMSDIRFGEFSHLQVEAVAGLASVVLQLPVSFSVDGDENRTIMRFAVTLKPEAGDWKMCSCLVSVPFDAGTYLF